MNDIYVALADLKQLIRLGCVYMAIELTKLRALPCGVEYDNRSIEQISEDLYKWVTKKENS